MKRPLAALPLAALLPLPACSAPPPPQACMAGLTEALNAGSFSGPVLCDPARTSFVLAGRTADGAYSIYDYRYRYRSEHGAVDHGGRRILIFRGETYLGQYIASPPPFSSISVQGSVVRFGAADSKPLDLTNGPPADTILDGQDTSFIR